MFNFYISENIRKLVIFGRFQGVNGLKTTKKDHSFSMDAKFSEKLTFLTPNMHKYVCVSGEKKCLALWKIFCISISIDAFNYYVLLLWVSIYDSFPNFTSNKLIDELRFPLKLSGNLRFFNAFRGERSSLTRLNSLSINAKFGGDPLAIGWVLFWFQTFRNNMPTLRALSNLKRQAPIFTSIFSIIWIFGTNPPPGLTYFNVFNISSLLQFSWWPNWLHGKPRIDKPFDAYDVINSFICEWINEWIYKEIH